MKHHRLENGFTLVDALVASAALLCAAAVAIPAIAGAHQTSRMSMDLSNLSLHGKLKDNFVAANLGRMPNAPAGTVDGPTPLGMVNTGPSSKPARVFAHPQYPVNGWAIPGGLTHSSASRLYQIAFGQYLVDGQGLDMLQDVFVSPGEAGPFDIRANWKAIRDGQSGFAFPADFHDDFAHPQDPYPGTSTSPENPIWRLSPSYRYTLAAIEGDDELGRGSFWGGLASTPGGQVNTIAWTQPSWTNQRQWVPESAFLFPSRKVMFFANWSSAPNAVPYTFAGAEIPVVMVDGSVRTTHPSADMPNPNTAAYHDLLQQGVHWGTRSEITYSNVQSPIQGSLAWFLFTEGGPQGFDFMQ